MRVTGGIYSGRKIECPKGVIRPAMDRMRESLFSILTSRFGGLEDLSFLDLFAGSGVVGIEAASRGACPVVLVEKDRKKHPVIIKNISIVESNIHVKIMPVERYRPENGPFSIVYLDPPFKYPEKETLISSVESGKMLDNEGICIIHHPSEETTWPEKIGTLLCSDVRRYGGSTLRFFRFDG